MAADVALAVKTLNELGKKAAAADAAGDAHAKLAELLGRLTATRAGYLDAAITSRASATDYTTARAALLDRLDATVASRATPAQVATEVDGKLNTASPATPTAGSVYDELDVLLGRLTSARAAFLDNMDAAVSSRLPTTTFDTRLSPTRAGLIDNLDALITSRASATDYTAARALKLDSLDAAVTTRATPAQVETEVRGELEDRALATTPTAGSVADLLRVLEKRPMDISLSGSLAHQLSLVVQGTGLITDPANPNGGTNAKLAELLGRLTSTRAGYLDAAITTRAAPGAEMALTTAAKDDAWARADSKVLSTTPTAGTVTDLLRAIEKRAMDITVTGSIAHQLSLAVAGVGSAGDVANAAGSANAKLAELLGRLTSARAAFLDAAITSRATPAQVETEVRAELESRAIGTGTVDSIGHRLNDLQATRVGATNAAADATGSLSARVNELLVRLSSARASNLDDLNTTVSSRMPSDKAWSRRNDFLGFNYDTRPTTFPPRYAGLSSGNNAWGSWLQLEASNPSNFLLWSIMVANPHAAGRRWRIQLGTGAGGAEVAKCDFIAQMNAGVGLLVQLPEGVYIASGTRIAIRIASDGTTDAPEISLNGMGG